MGNLFYVVQMTGKYLFLDGIGLVIVLILYKVIQPQLIQWYFLKL
jgi:hypothetical protein